MLTSLSLALLTLSGAAADTVRPEIRAARLDGNPSIDGRISEAFWQTAPSISQFTQVAPRDGSAPSQRSDIRVVYDGDALYIAARMFDSTPSLISARLGRRDANTQSDVFALLIDSYHDHRTAFRFSVNAAGVKADGIAANDGSQADLSWDAVWDGAAAIDSLGWTVEMRIPFSQLRYPNAAVQTWGINFERYIARNDELNRWSWVPSSETGFASVFGHLVDLRGVASARAHRIEVMPYLLSQGDFDSAADPSDPFNHARRGSGTIGADFKFGVSSGLTLTGTVNPDFGQVEADPAEVNLTVYETYFQERRPFFVEGANLFSFGAGGAGFIFGAPQLFYSRRVGRPPSGGLPSSAAFVDRPEVTSIHGAGKLSGQIGKWSLAFLDAVTAREQGRVATSTGRPSSVTIEPRANYAVAGLRRDFNGGATGIGLMGTSLVRNIDTASLNFLRSSAHAAGMDFYHRFGRNQYSVSGTFSASMLRGDSTSILSAQRSSARYYQRPDQDYVTLDPRARDMSGYATSVSGGKVSGKWLVGGDFFAYSPGFEINDMGFQRDVDRIFAGFRTTRRWLQPTKLFRAANVSATTSAQWNYGGTRTYGGMYFGGFGRFHNYWSASVNTNFDRASLSDRITRGGPLVLIPRQWNVNVSTSSDQRQSVSGSAFASVTRNTSGGFGNSAGLQLAVRPSTATTLTFAPGFNESHSVAGYVAAFSDSFAVRTYGRRYIVADLHQRSMDLTTRADIALTRVLSLQFYAQPFVAAVDYDHYKAIARSSALEFFRYGEDGASTIGYDAKTNLFTADPDGGGPAPAAQFGNPNFRVRSLRANLVLRWEYRPGSTLYFAWAHGREASDPESRFDVRRDIRDLFSDEQRNRVLVKVSYWFNP